MKKILWLSCFVLVLNGYSQELSASDLLDKAIAFHDPHSNWKAFNDSFKVVMETPNKPKRVSTITINLPKQLFHVVAKRRGVTTDLMVKQDSCSIRLNGKSDFSEEQAKIHRLSCQRAKMYRDYYTYLYGLPMKLKDPGSILDPKVYRKTFKGKEYLALKVTYDPEVGKDIWYFYFDPDTYAMEVYQFFHDETKNDGEYILLTETKEISGIKMPKNRAWYYNKDNTYLGTDKLQ